MTVSPSLVLFSRAAMPSNLLTVADWRVFAKKAFGLRSWESGMRRYAEHKGGALALMADDSLRVLTTTSDGKIRKSTYKPGKWAWDS